MVLRKYGKLWPAIVCLLLLTSCAKHKLAALGAPTPPAPTVDVPVAAPAAVPESKPQEPAKKVAQAKRAAPDVNRLLLEPPRMNFAREARSSKKDVPPIDKITFLVNTGDGTLRPESEVTIQNALRAIQDQFLFLCADRMRVGATEDCRFKTKAGLDDFFRVQLLRQGVETSEAGGATILVHAELISADHSAFDIRAVKASASSGEQLWHVVPRNQGDQKLELTVTPTARIMSLGDVQGQPEMLDHPVAVSGGETFFNDYGPAVIGSLAALGLLAWIAWTLWRNSRPSVFSNR
jgi:hypothetical protein